MGGVDIVYPRSIVLTFQFFFLNGFGGLSSLYCYNILLANLKWKLFPNIEEYNISFHFSPPLYSINLRPLTTSTVNCFYCFEKDTISTLF